MKKFLPYILGLLLLGGVVALFMTDGNKKNKNKKLNERVTFRRQDKIPYGTYVAYQSLSDLFPSASIINSRDEPGYWDSLSLYDPDQALIIVGPRFNADRSEMNKLIAFIEKGNDVFISTRELSYSASDILDCKIGSSYQGYNGDESGSKDSLKLKLSHPPYDSTGLYSYPGRTFDAYFAEVNEFKTEVLGTNENGLSNFIRMRAGKGNLFVHLAPIAFSNYFLLHKKNIDYYEKALSVISPRVEKVVWDEYYLTKRNYYGDNGKESEKEGWYSVLMNTENENGQRSFAAAFWVLTLLLLLYVLLEMRRKQRHIPVVTPPRNDSMDFVKTIGRLYFDKGDHRNLCRKMSAYFLEHVRSRYKLNTVMLNDEFIQKLQYKSGVPESEIQSIVASIQQIELADSISQRELSGFHQQLESFYNKT